MELSQIGVVAGLVLAGLAGFYAAFALAMRRRRGGRLAVGAGAGAAPAAAAARPAGPDPQLQAEAAAAAARRIERRLEEIEAVQADLAERLEETESASANARIEALAGSLIGLIRDKNATVETALAGLDQLRGRLHALEQMGEPAEARGLLERLTARMGEMQVEQAADRAAAGARFEALRTEVPQPLSDLADQLARLYAQKDATVETVFARLAPIEARMGEIQAAFAARDPQPALDGFAARLEEVQARLEAAQARSDGRLEDMQARSGERFAELQARIEALAEPGENPFAEISGQLTRLYAQKDATVETVFARLAPLEARLAPLEGAAPRLAALEAGAEARNPRAALAALNARLDALEGAQGEAAGRLAVLQAAVGDGGVAGELAERLGALEARLGALADRGATEDEARAEAQAIATRMITARTIAEQTEIFANRLSLLEASLPRLSLAQTLMMQALERQAIPGTPASAAQAGPAPPDSTPSDLAPSAARTDLIPPPARAGPAPEALRQGPAAVPEGPAGASPEGGAAGGTEGAAEDLEAIWRMPQVVSLHHLK